MNNFHFDKIINDIRCSNVKTNAGGAVALCGLLHFAWMLTKTVFAHTLHKQYIQHMCVVWSSGGTIAQCWYTASYAMLAHSLELDKTFWVNSQQWWCRPVASPLSTGAAGILLCKARAFARSLRCSCLVFGGA